MQTKNTLKAKQTLSKTLRFGPASKRVKEKIN